MRWNIYPEIWKTSFEHTLERNWVPWLSRSNSQSMRLKQNDVVSVWEVGLCFGLHSTSLMEFFSQTRNLNQTSPGTRAMHACVIDKVHVKFSLSTFSFIAQIFFCLWSVKRNRLERVLGEEKPVTEKLSRLPRFWTSSPGERVGFRPIFFFCPNMLFYCSTPLFDRQCWQ